jgi:phage terminase small subunit
LPGIEVIALRNEGFYYIIRQVRALTKKQKLFCEEYLIDLNATQAAIRAGYSPDTANEQGSRLLANVSVRAHIDKALAERSKRTGINSDIVLFELARMARANAGDIINFDDASLKDNVLRDDTAAIASVKVKKSYSESGETVEREIKLHDKTKSLELLGKHLGMFTDKVQVEGKIDTGTDKLADILIQLKDTDSG